MTSLIGSKANVFRCVLIAIASFVVGIVVAVVCINSYLTHVKGWVPTGQDYRLQSSDGKVMIQLPKGTPIIRGDQVNFSGDVDQVYYLQFYFAQGEEPKAKASSSPMAPITAVPMGGR